MGGFVQNMGEYGRLWELWEFYGIMGGVGSLLYEKINFNIGKFSYGFRLETELRRMKRCTEKEIKRKKEEKVVLKIRKGLSTTTIICTA